jgi:gentisate 1,2-dioxygenase
MKPDTGMDEYSDMNIEQLISKIETKNCTPGWIDRVDPILRDRPHTEMLPAHWRYKEIRPALQAAGQLIGTNFAERRNFVLRNPSPKNEFATTRTLVGAYQTLLPGERARSHRHSPHALRVILEAKNAYSVVNGERHPMESGDIVLTPGGFWHGHGHDGLEQAYWFDCLDVPLVHLLEPMTHDPHPDSWESDPVHVKSSHLLYRSEDIKKKLAAVQRTRDPFIGRSVDLSSPLMPTITIEARSWPRGWAGAAYREMASSIYVVLQGNGVSRIDAESFEWSFGDVFVAPLWARQEHRCTSDAILVALSDSGLMKHSRYYKSEPARAEHENVNC